VVVISYFDSLETALGSCLVCLGLNSPLHWPERSSAVCNLWIAKPWLQAVWL